MSNATAKAQSSTTPWGDSKVKRPLAAAAATYYPGTMIAIDSAGNAVKCDNTAGIRFDGLMSDSFRITVDSGDSAGDKKVTVDRPFRFTMYIASASAGDEGKAVYAAYDNEVSYSQTASIQVGWVDRVIDATTVEIRPWWVGVNGVVGFDSATLTFTGSTGGNTIVVPDNLADGLSVKEGSNSYVTVITTDASEEVRFLKSVSFYGDSGTKKVISVGSTSVAETLTVATGEYETRLTDNLADAWSVKVAGGNDLLTFTTTDSLESVNAAAPLSLTDAATLAATGADQAGAAAIVHQISFCSAADGSVGVRLPAATAGLVRIVYNLHATAGLKVYPATGDDINDGTGDAAVTIEGKTMAIFVALDTATWAAIYTANS